MGKLQLGIGTSLLLGFYCATAAAQSVRVVAATRELPRGDLAVEHLNQADCLANDSVRLTLGLEEYQGYALEFWAGTACENMANRLGGTATCWKVGGGTPSDTIYTAELRVRDLLLGLPRAGVAGERDEPSDSAACENAGQATGPQRLTTYALLVDANANVVAEATWTTLYRLNGSAPPTRVSAASGDRQLLVDFSFEESSSLFGDQFVDHVELFCDPPPNDADAAAGVVAAGDAGAPNAECPASSELIPGAPAASLQHLRCGSAPQGVLSGTAQGLVNGVSYNVALASVDTFGNVGQLSPIACQVPRAKPAAQVSSSSCSFAGTRAAQPGLVLTMLGLIGGALQRRRRRARGA